MKKAQCEIFVVGHNEKLCLLSTSCKSWPIKIWVCWKLELIELVTWFLFTISRAHCVGLLWKGSAFGRSKKRGECFQSSGHREWCCWSAGSNSSSSISTQLPFNKEPKFCCCLLEGGGIFTRGGLSPSPYWTQLTFSVCRSTKLLAFKAERIGAAATALGTFLWSQSGAGTSV